MNVSSSLSRWMEVAGLRTEGNRSCTETLKSGPLAYCPVSRSSPNVGDGWLRATESGGEPMNGGISKAFSAGDRRRTKWERVGDGVANGESGERNLSWG